MLLEQTKLFSLECSLFIFTFSGSIRVFNITFSGQKMDAVRSYSIFFTFYFYLIFVLFCFAFFCFVLLATANDVR